jgi:hypothetical protein
MKIQKLSLMCQPDVIDSYCRSCQRLDEHGQVENRMLCIGSFDEACAYLSVSSKDNPTQLAQGETK